MTQKYLTDKDCAERFSVSRDSIWRWTREKKFPQTVKLGEACTRWRLEDIEEWESERESAA